MILIYIRMPYQIKKNNDGTYRVINRLTGRVHAYHTSLVNAKAQIRLLYMREKEKYNEMF
jgi:hypothetical protein